MRQDIGYELKKISVICKKRKTINGNKFKKRKRIIHN